MSLIDEVKNLKSKKLNNAEIADHLGISKSQVKSILNGSLYDSEEETFDSDYSYDSSDEREAIEVALNNY